jgi:hypothetical protein
VPKEAEGCTENLLPIPKNLYIIEDSVHRIYGLNIYNKNKATFSIKSHFQPEGMRRRTSRTSHQVPQGRFS